MREFLDVRSPAFVKWVDPSSSSRNCVSSPRPVSPSPVISVLSSFRLCKCQPLEMLQPILGKLGAHKVQAPQQREPLELLQPFAGNGREGEVQALQPRQPFELFQSGVRDLGGGQIQALQLR